MTDLGCNQFVVAVVKYFYSVDMHLPFVIAVLQSPEQNQAVIVNYQVV